MEIISQTYHTSIMHLISNHIQGNKQTSIYHQDRNIGMVSNKHVIGI